MIRKLKSGACRRRSGSLGQEKGGPRRVGTFAGRAAAADEGEVESFGRRG
jgi:hypothetical protein